MAPSATAAPPTHTVFSPFPIATEAAERAAPQDVPRSALLNALGADLRADESVWQRIAAHLPCGRVVGGLTTELTVVLPPTGGKAQVATEACLALTPTSAAAMSAACREQLTLVCEPSTAVTMSRAVIRHIHKANVDTVALLRSVILAADAATDAAEAAEAAEAVVFRVALKPVVELRCSPRTQAVWFGAGHGNVCVVWPSARVLAYVEPACANVLPGIVDVVTAVVLPPERRHEFVVTSTTAVAVRHMGPEYTAGVMGNICTLWCAVAALLLLMNPVTSSEHLQTLATYVVTKQHWLLRLFVRLARERGCLRS